MIDRKSSQHSLHQHSALVLTLSITVFFNHSACVLNLGFFNILSSKLSLCADNRSLQHPSFPSSYMLTSIRLFRQKFSTTSNIKFVRQKQVFAIFIPFPSSHVLTFIRLFQHFFNHPHHNSFLLQEGIGQNARNFEDTGEFR